MIKNIDSPFTEIFSILTKYKVLEDNSLSLAYSEVELMILRQHINNATQIILQGLQDVAYLLPTIDKKIERAHSNEGIGSFIAGMCNLLEAFLVIENY